MKPSNYKIIFFGSSEFSIPSLEKLQKDGWNITLVITQPARPKGRGQRLFNTPVYNKAKSLGLEIKTFDTLKSHEAENAIAGQVADLAVVVSYGIIIPKKVLKLTRLGFVNIHPSLLPKYRGPSPIQIALLNGEMVTGVTLMLMDDSMDHGPIIRQETVQMAQDNFSELHDRLSRVGAELLKQTLLKWVTGKQAAVPQEDVKATFTKILTREHGQIDWKKPAGHIARQIRAYTPWPGTWTILEGKRLLVLKGRVAEGKIELNPGEIRIVNDTLIIGSGNKTLFEILKLQLEGKKDMAVADFLRGANLISGKRFE